ncbi:unnamed protein product [Microthlaspi erraticum]|uniref:Protein kinase domain-containing protein n=1 Tax=Microthlaspi erraticum TaxID=1685480 RepID=A0A6D2IZM1_9BRAS|nr:unnamed protein product [Microthlaspi erraticum]
MAEKSLHGSNRAADSKSKSDEAFDSVLLAFKGETSTMLNKRTLFIESLMKEWNISQKTHISSDDDNIQKSPIPKHQSSAKFQGVLPSSIANTIFQGDTDDDDISSSSFDSHMGDIISKQDLLMVCLLRIACFSEKSLARELSVITGELEDLGFSTNVPQFWKTLSEKSLLNSRYLDDFDELETIGKGAFGRVTLCKNKLDGRLYAVKLIKLKHADLPVGQISLLLLTLHLVSISSRIDALEYDDTKTVSASACSKVLREVTTLSRLHHQHVVRYYQAWEESGFAVSGSKTGGSSTSSCSGTADDGLEARGIKKTGIPAQDSTHVPSYLLIQMEHCTRTLRHYLDDGVFDKDFAWRTIRQIVDGLAYIHGKKIIHRDLKPDNIFLDSRNNVKIGDFGFAKSTKVDHDEGFSMDVAGSGARNSQIGGTRFYSAPEIEQPGRKIDEKADMYSLGVVIFELYHPFSTEAERRSVLKALTTEKKLPSKWESEYRGKASLVRRLLSTRPADRPSAAEFLTLFESSQSEFSTAICLGLWLITYTISWILCY